MRKVYASMVAAILALAIVSPRVVLAQAGSTSSQASAAAKSKASQAAEQLDINTASEAQLDALPGIGSAYAQKIIANRPYRSKHELVTKKVIPQATYNKIRDQIVAHAPTGSTAKPSGQ